MKSNAKVDKKTFARKVWLNYFNDYLFKNGHITEQEHKKMAAKILTSVSKMQPKR